MVTIYAKLAVIWAKVGSIRTASSIRGRVSMMSQRLQLLTVAITLLGIGPPVQSQDGKIDPKEKRVDAYGDPLPTGAIARLGTGRLCDAGVYFLAFSPNGAKLATASRLGVLRIWEVGTGRELLSWRVSALGNYSPT